MVVVSLLISVDIMIMMGMFLYVFNCCCYYSVWGGYFTLCDRNSRAYYSYSYYFNYISHHYL